MFRLFGARQGDQQSDDEVSAQEPRQYAPGTKIGFDPQLITRFKGHHVSLLKLFGQIKQAAETGNYPRTLEAISTFKNVLQQHLLEENIRFYTYLRICLQKDAENARIMNAMKSEMESIGRVVMQFISHYLQFGIDETNVKKFLTDLQGIGAALEDRIRREETSLYTLYLPPASY
jgi:regulator of sigma D